MAAYGGRGVSSGSSGARSERAAAGSGTGFTTQEAAFRKPSLRRNRFKKNLFTSAGSLLSWCQNAHNVPGDWNLAHLIYYPFMCPLPSHRFALRFVAQGGVESCSLEYLGSDVIQTLLTLV